MSEEPDKSLTKDDLEHGLTIGVGTFLGCVCASVLFGRFDLKLVLWVACAILVVNLPFSTFMHRHRRLKAMRRSVGKEE